MDVADRLIRDTHRSLRTAGEQLHPEASPATLHRARIRTKQFRYALECLSAVYGKPARRLIRRAARLQDVLGAAQDAAVLQELLRQVSQPEHALPPTSVFLLGQLSEVYAERMRLARAEAPAIYKRLTGRPWKRLKQRARTAILET
jgi:CHAD domain-containing protein